MADSEVVEAAGAQAPSSSRKVRDPKPSAERITQLASRVLSGDIVLPEFQRPFVWKRHQIIELLDSIYRNYPIGSLLLWESTSSLTSKRSIAGLEIADRSPTYPWNYLLDGQQRLSSVCGVLYWTPDKKSSVWNVAFDLKKKEFFHVDTLDDLPLHQIPMRRLPDPSAYWSALATLTDEALKGSAKLLFDRFTDYIVPLVTLGDMSLHDVAPIFERINSTGTRLTIFDLMRAATWSTSFDLGKSVENLRAAIEPKRFAGLDDKVYLRALSASTGGSFNVESIDELRKKDSDTLGKAVSTTEASAKLACDFLTTQVGVPRYEALPYANQFAVLCEIVRLVPNPTATQVSDIRHWFWRTTLSGYFGGWNTGQMTNDSDTIRAWASDGKTALDIGTVTSNSRLWRTKTFRANSATAKMLALMLAAAGPKDLITGQSVDIDKSLAWSNDKEFHHFFPQAFLKSSKKGNPHLVSNIVLLTSVSNIAIRDQAPSAYLHEIIDRDGREALVARLATNLVSEEALAAALADDYDGFLTARSATLQARALELCGETQITDEAEVDPDEVQDSDEDSLL
ncbi:GmrSD restriction endonuclease domain-containing protein [Mycolicibacterium sp. Dal123E01]|uniref:GmrSD restriction endonuclease domain-containing protein n=1 Tax=Mycolicibacterium sp. Dal123E01 TaxID=3457578 RepID=UPI00403EE97E